MLANMAVDPAFDNALIAIEAILADIQGAIDQVRIDLDGYAYQVIDPAMTAIERFTTKLREADPDVMPGWLVAEVQRAVALRNQ